MKPLDRAMRSLQRLAVGDALGKTWSTWAGRERGLRERLVPEGTWPFTDDTVMAMAIVSVLAEFERIDQDRLASEFAARFAAEPERGYGAGAFWLLHQFGRGRDWREASNELFRGGSFGNGSAMRVAPIGAFFADDLDRVVEEARASAEVTHAHPEGQAGAIAIALATALNNGTGTGAALVNGVLERTPTGRIYDRVARVTDLLGASIVEAVSELGDGREVCCYDTVPFALWCIATHPANYEDAIFAALKGTEAPEADGDTMLAIVGGAVAMASAPPGSWVASLESI